MPAFVSYMLSTEERDVTCGLTEDGTLGFGRGIP